ncbi:MAG TPA: DUF2182 domain-containing protein [Gemmatimonadaceae bacterium]|nr:DUF2182 domain-containing protein [Gemmatimonadaceae bacterium]
MPNGPMAMAGMSVPADGWLRGYPAFVSAWVVMMAAMMLPSLLPKLWEYARAVRGLGAGRAIGGVAAVWAGYLGVWAAIGVLVYPVQVAFGAMGAGMPAVARIAWIAVVSAAALALHGSAWRGRHLRCWRAGLPSAPTSRGGMRYAFQYGTRLGVHCSACGAGYTAVALALGVMDLRVMALATAAITLERLPLDVRRGAWHRCGVRLGRPRVRAKD